MRDTGLLKRLFEYKAWANAEALAAMAQMDAQAPTTEIAIRTMSHTLVVDEIFAAHMKGVPHAHEAANTRHAPQLADLSEVIRANDRDLVDYVSGLADEDLGEVIDFTFTDGEPGRMSRGEMLMHLIVHGGLHRGQVGWIMTLDGVTPPADGLTGYLHKAEATARRRTPVEAGAAAASPPEAAPANPGPAASRLEALTARLGAGLAAARLGKSVKFDLKGEGVIRLADGAASNEDGPADLTVTVSIDDLHAIGRGKLSLMAAVSGRRLVLSDMGVAVGLQGPLKALIAAAG